MGDGQEEQILGVVCKNELKNYSKQPKVFANFEFASLDQHYSLLVVCFWIFSLNIQTWHSKKWLMKYGSWSHESWMMSSRTVFTCDMLRWSSNERVQYRNQHTWVVVFCFTFDSDNCERSSSAGLILFKWSELSIFTYFWNALGFIFLKFLDRTYMSEMVDQLPSNKMDQLFVLIDWKQVRYRKPILIFDFELNLIK